MDGNATPEEREEELSSIAAIFPELEIDPEKPFCARLDIPVELASPLKVYFAASSDGAPPSALPTPPTSENDGQQGQTRKTENATIDAHKLSYLPPLRLEISLPSGYPENEPPHFSLSATASWLPQNTITNLQNEGEKLWEEYGRSQVVYGYIDFLQQAAERSFDLVAGVNGVELSDALKITLLDFDKQAKRRKFEQGTFDCGVCLDPKKGSACYQMERCHHVFCISCLKDFYGSCITEGDVASVKCMDFSCGKKPGAAPGFRETRKQRTLSPSELLQIPLEYAMVKRYVELKRKKKIEADKTTIYCPRTWCQGPARSTKYPKITSIDTSMDSDSEDEADTSNPQAEDEPLDPAKVERLAVCEDCEFAFCRTCLAGWHGEFVRCWPRTAAELSEDEQASYNYIRANTSPCPTCNSPVQKTHGCNHMTCFQCRTHFCYLCSSWLDSDNPYAHFNKEGTPCYQLLWELEEGDDGQGGGHFDGPRALEIAAIELLQADLQEEANAQAAAAAADAPAAPQHQGRALAEAEEFADALNNLNIQNEQAPNANQNAVRAPRPAVPAGRGAGRGHVQPQLPRRGVAPGLQRFIAMAQNDEEDDWDSDELDDDENDFANLA